jgi:hypothetical protein
MLTLSDNKQVLKIFDRFEINTNLPKHVRKTLPIVEKVFLTNEGDINNINLQHDQQPFINSGIIFGSPMSKNGDNNNLFKNIFKKILAKFSNEKKYELIKLTDFFTRIPLKDLESAKSLIAYYEECIVHAEKIGQVSLRERLLNNLSIVRSEITLIDNALTKFVAEDQLVDLYKQSVLKDNLKLTWIKNFVKVVPSRILEIKEKVDALEIFDNYVVLHYDPNNDATSLTKQEIVLKKDPILFGVFKESRKLYYIADWVDEYCDLTLEKMFNILQEKVLEINNNSVKSFINDNRNYIVRQKNDKTTPVTI